MRFEKIEVCAGSYIWRGIVFETIVEARRAMVIDHPRKKRVASVRADEGSASVDRYSDSAAIELKVGYAGA